MSQTDAEFWITAHRRVAVLQGAALAATLRAYRIIRDSFTDAELAKLIAAGLIERVLAEAFSIASLERAALPVRSRIRQIVQDGLRYVVKDVPKAGKVDGVLAVQFNVLSPDVITALRTLDGQFLTPFTTETQSAIRVAVEAGLKAGQAPAAIARGLRDVIGLSPTQSANLAKYRAGLVADGASSIETKVASYAKEARALNANTVSRTATLQAYKAGQDLAWQNAVDAGIVNALTKTWVGILDDRERDEHVAMEGETVPFDEPYSNGNMIPGDDTYNCRCLSRIRAA